MTKKIYKADFVKAQQLADHVLNENNIQELPVKVKKIVNSFPNLKVRTYSWFAKKRGYSHSEVCNLVDSEEGCCLYYESLNAYLILYNDKISNKGRKRWTLAHELGHYVMNHNKITNNSSLSRSSLSDDEYNEFESEANCFARELLAPPPVLNELNLLSPSHISSICDISGEASANVSKFLIQGAQFGKKYPPHNPVLKQFSGFINKIKNSKKCKDCDLIFSKVNALFCPSCGNKNLIKIPYSSIEENFTKIDDHNDKIIKCPNCNNGEITKGSNYCRLCGSYLINKCSGFKKANDKNLRGTIKWHNHDRGCGEFLDSKTRYCHNCGSTSTYFEDGLLKFFFGNGG
ncbi:ImmA/IrrE family metallo-endopeptidase [Metabacillus idriensis]|uniref:ImmA/IrrE family metallo-endopeptidase n=1 Tax=Metabacillus idriensis TaxID=324768 RepID=UPI00174A108B|nr:ImmA/IrrE family metallo-endopeptidase [Metabacillus idriensis]